MKYTKEVTDTLVQQYQAGTPVENLAQDLKVPTRSVIAKLSSLGIYQRKQYRTKRGEIPRKKADIIEKVAVLLNLDLELCESLEKVSKVVLLRIEEVLDPKSTQAEQAATVDPNSTQADPTCYLPPFG